MRLSAKCADEGILKLSYTILSQRINADDFHQMVAAKASKIANNLFVLKLYSIIYGKRCFEIGPKGKRDFSFLEEGGREGLVYNACFRSF